MCGLAWRYVACRLIYSISRLPANDSDILKKLKPGPRALGVAQVIKVNKLRQISKPGVKLTGNYHSWAVELWTLHCWDDLDEKQRSESTCLRWNLNTNLEEKL